MSANVRHTSYCRWPSHICTLSTAFSFPLSLLVQYNFSRLMSGVIIEFANPLFWLGAKNPVDDTAVDSRALLAKGFHWRLANNLNFFLFLSFILTFASFVFEMTRHRIFQEGGRGQQRATKCVSCLHVRGLEPAIFASRHDEVIRLTTLDTTRHHWMFKFAINVTRASSHAQVRVGLAPLWIWYRI